MPRLYFSGWLVLFSVVACTSSSLVGQILNATTLPQIIKVVEPSIVRIDVETATGEGVGSGFLISSDQFVVTNFHVIEDAKKAKVSFANGETEDVEGFLIADPAKDLAVLRISASNAPFLQLAEKLPEKGESLIAFGAPAGLSFSATEGIASAVRTSEELHRYDPELEGTWLQTSTPISPGNSGGPLVNRSMRVVAMNTMSLTKGQNLNFAISCLDIASALEAAQSAEIQPLTALPSPGRTSDQDDDWISKITVDDLPESSKASLKEVVAEFETATLDFIDGILRDNKLVYKTVRKAKVDRRSKKPFYFRSNPPSGLVVSDKKALLTAIRSVDADLKNVRDAIGNSSIFLAFAEPYKFSDGNEETLIGWLGGLAAGNTPAGEIRLAIVQMPDYVLRFAQQLVKLVSFEDYTIGTIRLGTSIKVNQVVSSDEFHGYIDDKRLVVRGYPTGSLVSDASVFVPGVMVSGTETYETVRGSTNTIHVLQVLPKRLLREVLGISESELADAKLALQQKFSGQSEESEAEEDDSRALPSPNRLWKSKSGHSVVAKITGFKGDSVILEVSKTGKKITVPVDKFTAEHQARIDKYKEHAEREE